MADRYLIETSAVDGYLLEDGTGVLLSDTAAGFTGTGDLAFLYAQAGSGKEVFHGAAAVALGFAVSATGAESLRGSGGAAFSFIAQATGKERFAGAGSLTGTFLMAGTGTSATAGTSGAGSLAFPFALASLGQERFTSSGATTFPFTASASGAERLAGAGELAFSFAIASIGRELFSGQGATAHTFLLAGSGTAAPQAFTGSGRLVFAFSARATGERRLLPFGRVQISAHGLFAVVGASLPAASVQGEVMVAEESGSAAVAVISIFTVTSKAVFSDSVLASVAAAT